MIALSLSVSVSDLELGILEVKMCGVAVHVGVTHLLTQTRVRGAVPGGQLLAAEVIGLRIL